MIEITNDILLRAMYSRGNTARIKALMRRAEAGERLVIGTLGGSITEGARAASRDGCYASLTAKWWRDAFPNAEITLVNAGIGATGSVIGAFRLDADLLSKKPDLVIVEYAVNDGVHPLNPDFAESYENIVRRILKTGAAVVMLMLPRQDKHDASAQQKPIGIHYALPMISVTDAIEPAIADGRYDWSDYAADSVHPSPDGHVFIAGLLCELFESIRIDRRDELESELPDVMSSDIYECAQMLDYNSLTPDSLGGFEVCENAFRQFRTAWKSDAPGESLVFTLENCRLLYLLFLRSIKPEYGHCRAVLEVDGENSREIELDATFEGGWGDYAVPLKLYRSDSAKHVKLTLTPTDGAFALFRIMKA